MKNQQNIEKEFQAAVKLLTEWNIIKEGRSCRVVPIKAVLAEYSKDKTYLFGKNLLEHLVNSIGKTNEWIPEYIQDHSYALRRFLIETTQPYLGNGNDALVRRFFELSNNFERKYNIKVNYDESTTPLENVNRMIDIGTKKLLRKE